MDGTDETDGGDETDAIDAFHEGDVLRAVVEELSDPSTLFVSNSMPVRDMDRFVPPSTASVTVLGNRGVSGIDGIVSTALGAGSATTDDLTLVIGDIALYHDTNGLLALDRSGIEATILLVNNDGGGIFHGLPIESFEPEFTDAFKTPHDIDFESMADLHGLEYVAIETRPGSDAGSVGNDGAPRIDVDDGTSRIDVDDGTSGIDAVADAYAAARDADGSHLIEVRTDAESSHRTRERLREATEAAVHGGVRR